MSVEGNRTISASVMPKEVNRAAWAAALLVGRNFREGKSGIGRACESCREESRGIESRRALCGGPVSAEMAESLGGAEHPGG